MSHSDLYITRSIIAPECLINPLEEHYPLSVSEINLLSIGDNDHYLVKANNTHYVLRIYRHNKHWLPTKEYHAFEFSLINFLHNHAIPVSHPIPRKDGTYINTLYAPEGARYWTLFTHVKGKEMPFTIENCYQYGQIISRMHNLTNLFSSSECSNNIDISFLLHIPFERIQKHAHNISSVNMKYLNHLIPELDEHIDQFHNQRFTHEWGVIGGDFHGGNHLIDSRGNINLFDFDLSGYGWRTYDIAVFKWALYDICRRAPRVRNRYRLWNAFLKGYQ
jgi:Ser/Thr protein kinase RdoA (MazF antagonist)